MAYNRKQTDWLKEHPRKKTDKKKARQDARQLDRKSRKDGNSEAELHIVRAVLIPTS